MTHHEELARVASLSPQQHEVMRLVCAGETWEVVAERLGIGYGSVKTVRNRIYRKLGLTGMARPALRAAYMYGKWERATE